MLLLFVALYMIATIAIGAGVGRLVKNPKDFVLAGRSLPLPMASVALFATWFGSETVLGASSEFIEKGAMGIIEDPLGAVLGLTLIGLFIARPLYRMNILTFCDFYRNRFGARAEWISAFFMVPSYFGWIAAQLVAIGIILHTVAGIPTLAGAAIGGGAVLIYTYIGGMWAVSVTDFIQTIFIVVGLLFLAIDLSEISGGLSVAIAQAPPDFFRVWPKLTAADMFAYIAAWLTLGLGSLPQQDVFQRIMASKSEKVAVQSAYVGAGLYLTIGLMPIFIGLFAMQAYAGLSHRIEDPQMLLPTIVMEHTGIGMQVLFLGALLSAIMSTASGAILAPASVLAENLARPHLKDKSDENMLRWLRGSVVFVTIASLIMASWKSNIHELVAESSALSLVSLFVPLIWGLYVKKATQTGAVASMVAGMAVWLFTEWLATETVPPMLWGLFASVAAQMVGDWWANRSK